MKVIVNNTCAVVNGAEQLTSGMVGKTVDVEYSDAWDNLTRIAFFTNGTTTKAIFNPADSITIPWEVLTAPGKRVSIGFYGYNTVGGEKVIAIPTIWAELGAVRAGASPSCLPPAPPTPEIWEQIIDMIGNLEDLDTEAKNNLVAAINEALKHGGGGGSFDIHTLRLENNLADTDETPFYDISASASRKTTWQNVKAKLKEYFDTVYLGIGALSGYATQAWVNAQGFITSLAGYATQAWVEAKGYLTEHQSLAAYRTASDQDEIDNTKVDKVTGKGLSTNDYTNEDKAKVASAVQPSDLDEYAKTADVPTQLSQLSGDNTHRVVTDAEKTAWNGKQNTLTAGFGISIVNNTISVDLTAWNGGSY